MEVNGPRILVGHWSISGASTPSGIPTDQFREPVIPLAELEQIGFDAVVFGHIHKPQTLQGISSRPIFYVGSPMALNFGETGSEHGAWLLDFVGAHGEAYSDRARLAAPPYDRRRVRRGVRRLSDRRRRRSRDRSCGYGRPRRRPAGSTSPPSARRSSPPAPARCVESR